MALTEDTRLRAREIVGRYPRSRSALLPMLHLVQAEEGYVSPDGIALCAEELGLTKAEVGAVATFYTMYKRRPTGDWLVSVCTNTVCGMLGGDAIYASLSEQLGVRHDQTTPDGTITLEHAECLAACDYAPVVTVNYEFYDNQDTESATDLVKQLREGSRPAPTRGAPLCTFKEMSRQLAGFRDERADAVGAGPAGEPTLAGARFAAQHLQTAPGYPVETPNGRAAAPAARPAAVPAAKPAEPVAKPAAPISAAPATAPAKPAATAPPPAAPPASPPAAPAAPPQAAVSATSATPAAPARPATPATPAAPARPATPAASAGPAASARPAPPEPGKEAAADPAAKPAAKPAGRSAGKPTAGRPTARPSGRPTARRGGARPGNPAEAAGAGRSQPSAHDAPLSTSDSDPDNASDPADEKGD